MIQKLINLLNFHIFFHCVGNIFLIRILAFEDLIKLLKSTKKRKLYNSDFMKISKRIKRANQILGHNTCLNNSVCLYNYIKNDHQKIDFVIGVKNINNEFSSHSWVEVNNQPVNEAYLTQYKEILRINNL